MSLGKRSRVQVPEADFESLPYLGITIAQKSAEKIANQYRKRGRHSMGEKDYVTAGRNFAASLFTELSSKSIRWDVVRDLRELIERACDARVADAVAVKKPLTSAQIRSKREMNAANLV
jgi:hypothetical protein